MKGVLTPNELNKAIEQAIDNKIIQFKDEQNERAALKLYLVDGVSCNRAMTATGVHRTKISTTSSKVLDQWRLMVAATI